VGGDRAITVNEFAGTVAGVFGRTDYEPRPSGKYRFGDTRHIVSDISKLKALGWTPTRTTRDSVEAYREWIMESESAREALEFCQRQMEKLNVVRDVAKD